MPKQTTIENFYASGEKFISLTAYFPGGGHAHAEGRIRRIPSGGTTPPSYWVARMCLNHNAVLTDDDCRGDGMWKIYSHDFGSTS